MNFLLSPIKRVGGAVVRVAVLVAVSVFLAIGQIMTNKLRSLLTTIGIVIGVASVATVAAGLAGFEAKILGELETFGTNKLFVFPTRTSAQQARGVPWSQIRFKPEIFDDVLRDCPTIKSFSRQMGGSKNIRFEQTEVPAVDVTGIEPAWHQIEHRFVITGRTFSLVDNDDARAVCLVNRTLQDKLRLNRDPSGQAIYLGDRRFTVVGLIDDDPNTGLLAGESGGAEVFIPFRTAVRLNPNNGFICIAAARTTDVSDEAVAELGFYMRNKRGIRPGDEDDFVVRSVARLVEIFTNISNVTKIVATGIVAVSLLVGGVGIMNIMLVSVSERTREIGLRKAVGAKPSAILLQFLIEAVVLCGIGGAMGLAIAQLLVWGLRSIPQIYLEKAYITSGAIYLAFGFSAAVGVIFGMFPAIKAARLDPIDALRHE